MPASVELLSSTVSGMINLSSLDKQQAASKINMSEKISTSSFYQNLDGIKLVLILIFLAVCLLAVAWCLIKNKKVLLLLLKAKDFLFWNFLIRYFQVSFITFNYKSLNSIVGFVNSEMATSIMIVSIQYGLVLYSAYYLTRKPLLYLANENTRKIVGNLYPQLDAT